LRTAKSCCSSTSPRQSPVSPHSSIPLLPLLPLKLDVELVEQSRIRAMGVSNADHNGVNWGGAGKRARGGGLHKELALASRSGWRIGSRAAWASRDPAARGAVCSVSSSGRVPMRKKCRPADRTPPAMREEEIRLTWLRHTPRKRKGKDKIRLDDMWGLMTMARSSNNQINFIWRGQVVFVKVGQI
jgi:hypothetical protein